MKVRDLQVERPRSIRVRCRWVARGGIIARAERLRGSIVWHLKGIGCQLRGHQWVLVAGGRLHYLWCLRCSASADLRIEEVE